MNHPVNHFAASSNNSGSTSSDSNPIDDLLSLLCDEEDWSPETETEPISANLPEISASKTTESLSASSNCHDDCDPLDVEVEEPSGNMTLEAAVNYEAFLRQTTESQEPKGGTNLTVNRDGSEALAEYTASLEIDTESASSEELVESVNTLIPLIVELLQYQINDSRDAIIQAVTPILERLIEQRSTEEPQKMAMAIAKILPRAIAEKIKLSPEEIAKAIAPELALSIKEQIRLDENAISEALGSQMGKAIKTQIELERDAMVDALYPVIGSTISKYMVEVVQEINTKVENTLSPDGIKRKIRAKLKGVSEAELILQESIGCHVQAVFVIHKDSGLIIQQVQKRGEPILDADMVGGMLTAIRSFANDCIVSGSELDSIDYGNWQIHLEAAGYCYLAIVLQGNPNQKFINKVREIFGDLILQHGKEISRFNGDRQKLSPAIKLQLEQLIEPEDLKPEKTASSPSSLLWLLAFLLALILIPWGIVSYRDRLANHIEQLTATQLDAAPELSVYRLEPNVKAGKLTVTGRVPSNDLRQQAAVIGQQIATKHHLEWDNQIQTVELPVNPGLIMGEISRLTELFNQDPQVQIATNYQAENLAIRGFILDQARQESIIKAYARIPGIKQTVAEINNQLPQLQERIYFEIGSDQLNLAEVSPEIESIIEFLQQYPQLHLKLIAYSDTKGSKKINQELGRRRCLIVRTALIAKGVESSKLVTDCGKHRLTQEENNRAFWSSRYVRFEPFIP